MLKIFLSVCIFSLLYRQCEAQLDPSGPIAGFVRTNVIGFPVIHEKKTWIFDPNIAQKRRRSFIELHGDKGDKLIERIGLGIDGNDQERLANQRARDDGHLGGLNTLLP